jgi:hypothetical protein
MPKGENFYWWWYLVYYYRFEYGTHKQQYQSKWLLYPLKLEMNLKISCRKKKSSSSSSVVELLRGKRRGPNDKRRRVSLAPNGASPYVPPSLLIRAPPSSPYTQAPPIPRLALLLTLSLPMCFLPCQRRRDLTHTHTRIYVNIAPVISRTLRRPSIISAGAATYTQ